jgi:transposase-like protein
MYNKMTPALKEELMRRVEKGETKLSIASAMNLSYHSVLSHTPKSKLSEQQIREIVRLVENGNKTADVARQFRVTPMTVRRYTKHIDRQPARISLEKKNELIQRVLTGEQISSIARDLKLCRPSAVRIAQRALCKLKLSDVQKTAIMVAKREGKTAAKIALDLKLPLSIVLASLGTFSSIRYSKTKREAVIRSIEAGETVVATAKKLGTSRPIVSRWFIDAVNRGDAQRPLRNAAKSDDFAFMWITRRDPELEEWRKLIASWFENKATSAGLAIDAITAFVDRYLIALNLPKNPVELLQRGRHLPNFLSVTSLGPQRCYSHNKILHGFIEWVLDSPGFADIHDGEIIRLSHLYRNPFNPAPSGQSSEKRGAESNKIIMAYYLISDLRKRIVQGPNFRDWTWVLGLSGRETINGKQNGGDWFAVAESRLDRNDPDCVWRLRQREKTSPVLEMWSPVRWVLQLIHLQTTSRVGQARMVDSGEADTFIWQDGKFVPNCGPLKQGTVRKPREQGIFRRPSSEDAATGAEVYLYFNSNKTADIGRRGKEKGFVCAWPRMESLDEDPYYWLAKLRDWQIKYNPIDQLTAWNELTGDRKLSARSKVQLAEYPDTAFLFRAPESPGIKGPISAFGSSDAWQKLMLAYENILLKEGIQHASGGPIELINPENGRAWSSPHATRVSLITHLILDGHVPVELMMKIVGHAHFIMTVYYTKPGLTRIQDAIKGATEKLDAVKYETFERDLLNTEVEQVRDKIVFNAEDWKTVLPVNPADRTPLGWLHLQDGICLAGGNAENTSHPGCHDGGPEIIAAVKTKKARHGPVPGGVRNCCRCRWKCAGKHHVLALAATLNNRSYHLHRASSNAIAAERERNKLMRDKARVESTNQPYAWAKQLIDAERKYEAAMQTMQQYALDVVALNRMINRIMALPEHHVGPAALAAQGDVATLNSIIEETDSKLLTLAGICADVELFPDLDPGPAVFEFAQLLDQAFEREGQPLILARLSENEKMTTANFMMRELERHANPRNPLSARRQVVEIMDRGESLEKMLGIKLKNIAQLTNCGDTETQPLRFAGYIGANR